MDWHYYTVTPLSWPLYCPPHTILNLFFWLSNMGNTYKDMSQTEEAISCYKTAIRVRTYFSWLLCRCDSSQMPPWSYSTRFQCASLIPFNLSVWLPSSQPLIWCVWSCLQCDAWHFVISSHFLTVLWCAVFPAQSGVIPPYPFTPYPPLVICLSVSVEFRSNPIMLSL